MMNLTAETSVYQNRSQFLAGIRAELPILVGVIPFGMIYGVLALSAGIPEEAAQAMSFTLFAGSAQIISAQLYGAGAPGLVIALTAAVVNLRHLLYSASLAPFVRSLSPGWKGALAYLLTDEAYAVTILHYLQPDEAGRFEHSRYKHWFFLGSGLALWGTWQLSTAVGIFFGTQMPTGWSLDFTLPLTFIALVVPALKDRPGWAAALSAGLVAVLSFGLPYKLGLMASGLVGILVGLWMERRA
jgi:4-azaleucine resistance transporter AzlC